MTLSILDVPLHNFVGLQVLIWNFHELKLNRLYKWVQNFISSKQKALGIRGPHNCQTQCYSRCQINNDTEILCGRPLKTWPPMMIDINMEVLAMPYCTNPIDFPLGRSELSIYVYLLGGLQWASWDIMKQHLLLSCGQSGSIILLLYYCLSE